MAVTRTRPRFDVTRIAGDDAATLRAITVATVMGFDGVAWFEAIAPTRYYELHGVWPQGATDTWLAGLVRTGARDSGRASRWNRVDGERDVLDAPTPLRAITARASDDVWAVGDGGAAWRFDGSRVGARRDGRDSDLARRVEWLARRRVGRRQQRGAPVGRQLRGGGSRSPSMIDAHEACARSATASDVWMTGGSESASRAYALHWDGVVASQRHGGPPRGLRGARGVGGRERRVDRGLDASFGAMIACGTRSRSAWMPRCAPSGGRVTAPCASADRRRR